MRDILNPFQYLTGLKGFQERACLYATKFLSSKDISIFDQEIPKPLMGPLHCPLQGVHIGL